jgi:hypothetical protein
VSGHSKELFRVNLLALVYKLYHFIIANTFSVSQKRSSPIKNRVNLRLNILIGLDTCFIKVLIHCKKLHPAKNKILVQNEAYEKCSFTKIKI